jgi:hypothetical protein
VPLGPAGWSRPARNGEGAGPTLGQLDQRAQTRNERGNRKFLLFYFFSQFSKYIYKSNLNRFKLQTKPLHTVKQMHQHECINMFLALYCILILIKVLFPYVKYAQSIA